MREIKEKILNLITKYKVVFISILITICIEIFICNYPFFRTILVGNINTKKEFEIEDNTIRILDINTRVTSININYKNQLEDKVTYKVKYSAEDNSDVISLKPKVVLKYQRQYINLDTHVKCQAIQIELETANEIDIESVILNHCNFNINIFRMILIFMAVIFIAKIRDEEFVNLEFKTDSKFQVTKFTLNLVILSLFVLLYTLYQFDSNEFFINKEDINKEDSVLMQAESLANGKIPLMVEVDERLLEMENPYDHVKRDEEGINYLYDVAYYNGNYYNYFGIAPIITSILPFRILTGRYTHTYIFNMIYIFIAIFALSSLYKKIVEKYIGKITVLNYYLGFYAILFASNIFTLIRGQKYDIVVSSGIAFLLISLNLAISIYQNPKYKILKLILLGITTALIVLSKPNLLIYYILILFFVLMSMKDLELKSKIKDSIFIIVPLGIFAIFQMILNYVRFDNILEFGAKYQLTSFNMVSCMSITLGKIYAGIVEYIFRTPNINPLEFPFVFINTTTGLTSINEVCYENRLIGLIAIPILWVYLLKGYILKNSENKELKNFVNIIIIVSAVSIVLNTCFGGICEAYSIDFKLVLAIGAIVLLLKWLENSNNSKDINKIIIFLSVVTILTMVPISLTTEQNFLTNLRSDTTVYFKNLFEFWS